MKKVKFVYNPLSGKNGIASHVERIAALYATRGLELVRHELDFAADERGEGIVADIDPTAFDHLLVAGGDGTVNFVVNALKRRGIELPLALIPSGTANDFAHAIGMKRAPLAACRQILDGELRRVDLGCVQGEYFVNVFSFGLFTNVSQRTPTRLKNVLGKAAYLMEGLGELARIHHFPLEVSSDGGVWQGSALMMLAFNGRSAGSFPIARMARLDDGLLDILILKGDSPISTLRTFLLYLAGRAGSRPPKEVVHLRASSARVSAGRDEPTDIDGQPGPRLPVTLSCGAGAMQVIVPG